MDNKQQSLAEILAVHFIFLNISELAGRGCGQSGERGWTGPGRAGLTTRPRQGTTTAGNISELSRNLQKYSITAVPVCPQPGLAAGLEAGRKYRSEAAWEEERMKEHPLTKGGEKYLKVFFQVEFIKRKFVSSYLDCVKS